MVLNATNTNFSNAFNSRSLFIFDDRQMTEFWVKSFSLPGINLDHYSVDYIGHPLAFTEAKVTFGELNVDAFLDESFIVYKEQYNWMINSIPSESFLDPKKSGSILMFDNSMQTVIAKFNFDGLFITNIGNLSYDNFGHTHQVLSLSYKFDNFTPVITADVPEV